MRVIDRWWPHNFGIVSKIGKATVVISFSGKETTYDAAHLQFLKELPQ